MKTADVDVVAPGRYAIDPVHTLVEFVARHLVVKKVRGRFHDVTGSIVVDEQVEQSHAEASIGSASVDTGIAARDRHLRSADFFDADAHPLVTFCSTRVEPDRPGRWVVGGEVTILGRAHPVELDVTLERTWRTPDGHDTIVLRATAQVDREAWGLTWNDRAESGGLLIGRVVDLVLVVQAVATGP